MVGFNELFFDIIAGGAVDGSLVNFGVAVDRAVFFAEELVLDFDAVFEVLVLGGTQFTVEVFVIGVGDELVGLIGGVAEPVVEVVVNNRGAGAERNFGPKSGNISTPSWWWCSTISKGVCRTIQWIRFESWHMPPPIPDWASSSRPTISPSL